MNKPKILIVVRPDHISPKDELYISKAKEILNEYFDIIDIIDSINKTWVTQLADKCKFIFVFGGDGTMLSTIRAVTEHHHAERLCTEIIGINLGRLGFLTSFDTEYNFTNIVESILIYSFHDTYDHFNGNLSLTTQKYYAMEVSLNDSKRYSCINEAVIVAGQPFRAIHVNVSYQYSNDDIPKETNYFGDGVIVSTPCGSTAYNLSSGGPIIDPDAKVYSLTPLAAHTMSFRPLIISDRATIAINCDRVNQGTSLCLDGHMNIPISTSDKITIHKSKQFASVIRNTPQTLIKTLEEKMHWGHSK